MEYKRRRVSSAIDDNIEIREITEVKNQNNSNVNTLSVFEYYKLIFIEFRKLMCCCQHNNCEDD